MQKRKLVGNKDMKISAPPDAVMSTKIGRKEAEFSTEQTGDTSGIHTGHTDFSISDNGHKKCKTNTFVVSALLCFALEPTSTVPGKGNQNSSEDLNELGPSHRNTNMKAESSFIFERCRANFLRGWQNVKGMIYYLPTVSVEKMEPGMKQRNQGRD